MVFKFVTNHCFDREKGTNVVHCNGVTMFYKCDVDLFK